MDGGDINKNVIQVQLFQGFLHWVIIAVYSTSSNESNYPVIESSVQRKRENQDLLSCALIM